MRATLRFISIRGKENDNSNRQRGPCILPLRAESARGSVVSNSLGPHGLWSARLLCPWHPPGKNMVWVVWVAILFPRGSCRPGSPALQADSWPSEPPGTTVRRWWKTEAPRYSRKREKGRAVLGIHLLLFLHVKTVMVMDDWWRDHCASLWGCWKEHRRNTGGKSSL